MKVTEKRPQEILVYNLDIMTLEEFLEENHKAESFGWCNGYLVRFNRTEGKKFDKGYENGQMIYRSIDVAPLPVFQREIQARYAKIPIFDMSHGKVQQAVVDYVKENKL